MRGENDLLRKVWNARETMIPPLSIPNLLSAEKILTNVECHTNAHQEGFFFFFYLTKEFSLTSRF